MFGRNMECWRGSTKQSGDCSHMHKDWEKDCCHYNDHYHDKSAAKWQDCHLDKKEGSCNTKDSHSNCGSLANWDHSAIANWLRKCSGNVSCHPMMALGANHPMMALGLKECLKEWADDLSVSENSTSINVDLAMPGVKPAEVTVNVQTCATTGHRYLEVEWARSWNESNKSDHMRWIGKSWSSCHKAIPIPEMCDEDAISAELNDGCMHIIMPKKAGYARNSSSRQIRLRSTR